VGVSVVEGFSAAIGDAGMRRKPVSEWTMDELKQTLERVRMACGEQDYKLMNAVVETLSYLTHLAKDKQAAEIYRILGSSKSEKTRKILRVLQMESEPDAEASDDHAPDTAAETSPQSSATDEQPHPTESPKKRKGHGRNGADDYTGARQIRVSLESMKPGDRCPCGKGNLYEVNDSPLVRIVGQAPLQADVYRLERLRCNTCGDVFTAKAPEGVGSEKYDVTSTAIVALMKYGSGFPFHRLERLESNLGIPLPASTQWEMVRDGAHLIQPAFEELIRQAASGEVLYNDDTSVKILEFLDHDRVVEDPKLPGRTGIFTTGIVSTKEGLKIALFFSGRKHAGENLADVLAERAKELPAPIQMCDALPRNLPGELKVILANCLVHGRRYFVEAAANFPEECRYILELLGKVYLNDAITRQQAITPDQRLTFHQTESAPLMDEMKRWLNRQIDEKLCEPNSDLGTAIAYMLNHWEPLTVFLRVPGSPLDSSIVERALKKAILHRRNSLFYKTQRGARVGDLFMSLIYTCQLSGVNPFDYLTALLRNFDSLAREPVQWMPWNYSDTLVSLAPA
jgi:transposase